MYYSGLRSPPLQPLLSGGGGGSVPTHTNFSLHSHLYPLTNTSTYRQENIPQEKKIKNSTTTLMISAAGFLGQHVLGTETLAQNFREGN